MGAAFSWKWMWFWWSRCPYSTHSDYQTPQCDPESTQDSSAGFAPLWIVWSSRFVLRFFSRVVFGVPWFGPFCWERQPNLFNQVRLASDFKSQRAFAIPASSFPEWDLKPTREPIWPWFHGWSSLLAGRCMLLRTQHRLPLGFGRWLW